MLTINQLMKYLRTKHHITVKSNQAQDLRNMGYYHGFKGYRFIRIPSQKIPFTSLDEIIALNKFDMHLKALFYPKVMFIENALKSYVIESTLKNAKSENLDVIFNKSITDYRSYTPGSDMYHKQYAKRMMLKGKINSALIRDYGNNKKIVNHFLIQINQYRYGQYLDLLRLGNLVHFLHVQILMLSYINQQHYTFLTILIQMEK